MVTSHVVTLHVVTFHGVTFHGVTFHGVTFQVVASAVVTWPSACRQASWRLTSAATRPPSALPLVC